MLVCFLLHYMRWHHFLIIYVLLDPGLHLLPEGAKTWNAINVKKPFAGEWQSMPADEQETFRQYTTQTREEKAPVLRKVGKVATLDASATLRSVADIVSPYLNLFTLKGVV